MIFSASAVLLGWPRLATTSDAKSLVTRLGAGTGTRTPGLLITSNPGPSAVLTGSIAGSTRIAWERKPQSYQLNLRASRVDVVHSGQLTSRRSHKWPCGGSHEEIWFPVNDTVVAAQRRDIVTMTLRRPESAEGKVGCRDGLRNGSGGHSQRTGAASNRQGP